MASSDDYAIQVVKELRGGVLLYPKNIPGDRGSVGLILEIIITIILCAVCIYFASKNRELVQAVKYAWYCTASNILLITLGSLTWRICTLCEELRHAQSRYDGSIASAFASALQFNTLSIVVLVLCLATFIGMTVEVRKPLNYLWIFGPEAYIFSLISSLLVVRLINVDACRLTTSLTLSQMKGLDYGGGMAYSYFYGYLNIILPADGGEKKGLLENIELYENRNGVKIPVKKMFILIPTSMLIPPDLKEVSYGWLESGKPLETVVKNRAGVKNRSYHNTVYLIHPGGRTTGNGTMVYVVTEGATPLLTFYEVLKHSGVDSTSYNDFKKEIVGSFYKTLRHIIRSKPETRDLCELVFYEDFDPDGRVVNVAEILLDKIQEQTSLSLNE